MSETIDLPCAGPNNPTSGFGSVTYQQNATSVTANFDLIKAPALTTLSIGIYDVFADGSCLRNTSPGPTTNFQGTAVGSLSQTFPSGTVGYYLAFTNQSSYWTTALVSTTVTVGEPLVQTADLPCSGPVNPISGFGSVTYRQSGTNVTAKYSLTGGPALTRLSIGFYDVLANGSCLNSSVPGRRTSATGTATGSLSQTLPTGTVAYYLTLDNASSFWTTVSVPAG